MRYFLSAPFSMVTVIMACESAQDCNAKEKHACVLLSRPAVVCSDGDCCLLVCTSVTI